MAVLGSPDLTCAFCALNLLWRAQWETESQSPQNWPSIAALDNVLEHWGVFKSLNHVGRWNPGKVLWSHLSTANEGEVVPEGLHLGVGRTNHCPWFA